MASGLQIGAKLSLYLSVAALLGACGESSLPDDGGVDAAVRVDLGQPADFGVPDRGTTDNGVQDAGPTDRATADAAPPDMAPLDAATMDMGTPDAGCVPTGPEVCDGEDNDCDGLPDNIDEGGDGIFDCARIALFGRSGALGSSDFVAWLQGNGVGVSRVQTDTSTPLTAVLLADYDVVILDRLVRSYTQTEADALRTWVEGGGGLMSMTGYSSGASTINNPNSLLHTLGLEYTPGLLNGPVTQFVPHATTSSLTSVTFQGGFRVGVLSGPLASTSTVVASLATGPVGVAAVRNQGRVFVWGDEWIQFDSQWRMLPEIPIFWANILGWLEHLR